jgi:multicomponent Na+:H+ antiporter subunit D
MKALAFLCKGVCHFYWDATRIEELRGTAARMPPVAAAFGVALAGLAGVPPLAGFVAKWFMLMGTLGPGQLVAYLGVAAFVLNSLLALGYYLPLLGTLVRQPGAQPAEGERTSMSLSPWMGVPLAVLVILVLAIGLYPGPWLAWSGQVGSYVSALGR